MSIEEIERLIILNKIADVATKIVNNYMLKTDPIPNDLILEHNKLLNDYNEALKVEKSKQSSNESQ